MKITKERQFPKNVLIGCFPQIYPIWLIVKGSVSNCVAEIGKLSSNDPQSLRPSPSNPPIIECSRW